MKVNTHSGYRLLKLGMEGNFLNMLRDFSKQPLADVMYYGKRSNTCKMRNKTMIYMLSLPFSIVLKF